MSYSPESGPFRPNTVIELTDTTELHSFEDVIAEYLSPRMSPYVRERWASRTKLRDELRPPKFNGRIADIQLHVMENAAEMMASARERGLSFNSGSMGRLPQSERLAFYEEQGRVLGFSFAAIAKSTGRGDIGQIQAELWYGPATSGFGGINTIRRALTKPKIETQNFITLHEDSVRIALQSLRYAMRHAKPKGFHN